MSSYLIIFIFLSIIIIGSINKINCFDSFMVGCKRGITTSVNMFSTLLVFTISLSFLLNCGLIEFLKEKLNFDYSLIIIQCLVRPMSSSASLSIMTEIYNNSGVDSFKGLLSSMIHYISDASLYIIPFYCELINFKKYNKILVLGFIINICSYIISFLLIILFYKIITL